MSLARNGAWTAGTPWLFRSSTVSPATSNVPRPQHQTSAERQASAKLARIPKQFQTQAGHDQGADEAQSKFCSPTVTTGKGTPSTSECKHRLTSGGADQTMERIQSMSTSVCSHIETCTSESPTVHTTCIQCSWAGTTDTIQVMSGNWWIHSWTLSTEPLCIQLPASRGSRNWTSPRPLSFTQANRCKLSSSSPMARPSLARIARRDGKWTTAWRYIRHVQMSDTTGGTKAANWSPDRWRSVHNMTRLRSEIHNFSKGNPARHSGRRTVIENGLQVLIGNSNSFSHIHPTWRSINWHRVNIPKIQWDRNGGDGRRDSISGWRSSSMSGTLDKDVQTSASVVVQRQSSGGIDPLIRCGILRQSKFSLEKFNDRCVCLYLHTDSGAIRVRQQSPFSRGRSGGNAGKHGLWSKQTGCLWNHSTIPLDSPRVSPSKLATVAWDKNLPTQIATVRQVAH